MAISCDDGVWRSAVMMECGDQLCAAAFFFTIIPTSPVLCFLDRLLCPHQHQLSYPPSNTISVWTGMYHSMHAHAWLQHSRHARGRNRRRCSCPCLCTCLCTCLYTYACTHMSVHSTIGTGRLGLIAAVVHTQAEAWIWPKCHALPICRGECSEMKHALDWKGCEH